LPRAIKRRGQADILIGKGIAWQDVYEITLALSTFPEITGRPLKNKEAGCY